MKIHLFSLLLLPVLAFSQTSKKDSLWARWKPFLGTWIGQGEGPSGTGRYERTYRYVLGNNFIEIKNRAVYPPTEKKPSGEVHEDMGYISYDRNRKLFVLRQFHVESFVNQYRSGSSGDNLVFISEGIENIPAGWRARESYQWKDGNSFTEFFELAEPGKEFTLYTKVELTRQ